MHIILTGATGTVGAPVLTHLLASPACTRLSILSRRTFSFSDYTPPGNKLDYSKATIIEHKDFTSYPPELLEELKGAQACIWAQGISQNSVPKDEYIKITYDYPLLAASAFSSLPAAGSTFNFIYVSGEGADPTEKTWTLFGKIKGRAETALLELPNKFPNLRMYNVRPGYVLPDHPLKRRGLALKTSDMFAVPVLRKLTPGHISPTPVLAKALADLAFGKGEPMKEGEGIEAGGRTIRSSAVGRMGV